MQPFLSGEATLAWLLITLTLLLFAAAGDEHPYEPSYRKLPAGNAERSSVEMDNRPPVEAEELVAKLDALKDSGKVEREESTKEARQVVRMGFSGLVSGKPYPRHWSSYLPSCLRPRSLHVLAALLSYQSLHTMNIPSVSVLALGNSGFGLGAADISWSLGGLGLTGLPLMKTGREGKSPSGRSLPGCRGNRKSLKYVGDGGSSEEEVGQGSLDGIRSMGRVGEVGD